MEQFVATKILRIVLDKRRIMTNMVEASDTDKRVFKMTLNRNTAKKMIDY